MNTAPSPSPRTFQRGTGTALMAEEHLPLVAAMVRRFPWYVREREELYQQGCVGLMKAISRFDPSMGTAFSTYAATMILGEMRMLCRMDAPLHIPRTDRELRNRIRRAESLLRTSLLREPTVQELATVLRIDAAELVLLMEDIQVTSLDMPQQGRAMYELLAASDQWENRILLKDLISRLPKADKRLILLRYWMGKTQTETAKAMGMTQVQVSRRESAIKACLRHAWNEA